MNKQTKQKIITYLAISFAIYVILYYTNKKLFWTKVIAPPYP